MCRRRDAAANPLFSWWRALWRPTAPASRTKSRRTAEESRTSNDPKSYEIRLCFGLCLSCFDSLILSFSLVYFYLFLFGFFFFSSSSSSSSWYSHWGKAGDRNCNYGHPKMADVESGNNLFCRLICFYNGNLGLVMIQNRMK
jgi:hypothetical protein